MLRPRCWVLHRVARECRKASLGSFSQPFSASQEAARRTATKQSVRSAAVERLRSSYSKTVSQRGSCISSVGAVRLAMSLEVAPSLPPSRFKSVAPKTLPMRDRRKFKQRSSFRRRVCGILARLVGCVPADLNSASLQLALKRWSSKAKHTFIWIHRELKFELHRRSRAPLETGNHPVR